MIDATHRIDEELRGRARQAARSHIDEARKAFNSAKYYARKVADHKLAGLSKGKLMEGLQTVRAEQAAEQARIKVHDAMVAMEEATAAAEAVLKGHDSPKNVLMEAREIAHPAQELYISAARAYILAASIARILC